MPKYGRKDELILRAKDGSALVTTGKRYGYFFVHKMPGSTLYSVTHIASGIACVQGIKGSVRANRMAHVICSHDLPEDLPYAPDLQGLAEALKKNVKLYDIVREFSKNAGDPEYDPMQHVVKEIQTTIYEVIK